jgi:5-methylcytosine-specific restriction endonuclease McrA
MALYSVSRKSQNYHAKRGSYANKIIPIRKKSRREHKQKLRAPRKVRKLVMERDNYTCQCCDISTDTVFELSIHHIKHIEEGGSHDPSNLVTTCLDCHRLIHNDLCELIPSGKDPREFKHLFQYPQAS